MRTILRMLLVCLVVPAAVTLAQEKPAAPAPENPLSTWNKMAYGRVKDILLRSAEKMPAENYSFKPTEVVRSYGQILGHVADAQYTKRSGSRVNAAASAPSIGTNIKTQSCASSFSFSW